MRSSSFHAGSVALSLTVLLLAAACSSSSNSSSGSIPSCQASPDASIGTETQVCDSCLESQCGSQIAAVEGACSAYLSCIAACKCTDETCQANCGPSQTSDCENAESTFEACSTKDCNSQCTIGFSSGGTG